jgi:hypothetical protein
LPRTEVILARNNQLYFDPETVAFCWSKIPPPPFSATNAQIKMAIQAIGTTIDLIVNNQRSLFGCIHRNGSWKIQKIKNATIPFVVIPCEAGISLCRSK